MNYFIKTPWWLKRLYPKRIWSIDTKEKVVYLTFDDGPHPVATPFVLDELKRFNAKATFFCIGRNVTEHSGVYKRIAEEGHRVGNHTQNHLNGWKTDTPTYLADVAAASQHIDSDLFRPPYGRIRLLQSKGINEAMKNKSTKIVMWDVLSGDFDNSVAKEKCLERSVSKARPGSIIVFHDNDKAFPTLEYVLPRFLLSISEMEYRFDHL
ncbi:MAG TPA: polysaccharide deacetylase family protein [Chitinophagaceae bacterium]|jgi:peptidoglycan/xylan/chitin deacetylase (PgdA/CDA1 family)|nr:polysaccharide deacetylase family protein [Chitinophagaceae bacterium]